MSERPVLIGEMVGSIPPEGTEVHLCACGEKQPPKKHRPGQFYKRCPKCESVYRRNHPKRKERRERDNEGARNSRRSGKNVDRWICAESRSSDRKHNRSNDMTREFISELIKSGCYYCGDNLERMTLDRIDNRLGHLKTNVLPACIRCNLIRRDMPFEAWELIVPSIKLAMEKGAFGNWMPSPHKVHRRPLCSIPASCTS